MPLEGSARWVSGGVGSLLAGGRVVTTGQCFVKEIIGGKAPNNCTVKVPARHPICLLVAAAKPRDVYFSLLKPKFGIFHAGS